MSLYIKVKKKFNLTVRFIAKWIYCSWAHRGHRCYFEVWDRGPDGPWHCNKCHPCGEIFDIWQKKMDAKEKKLGRKLTEDETVKAFESIP